MTTATSNIFYPVRKGKASKPGVRRPRLTGAIREWEQLWNAPGLADHVSVVFSSRLSRTLGRSAPASGIVTLHASLLKGSRGRLIDVLCHETAHVATYMRHGRRARAHGREWAKLVTAAGFEPRASRRAVLKEARTPVPSDRYPVVHVCSVCQSRRFARRAVPAWRCAECVAAGLSGELVVTRVAKRVGR